VPPDSTITDIGYLPGALCQVAKALVTAFMAGFASVSASAVSR
jgi:23S rRNA U2552 (ribose-2'-O)-methylase RlmE/FtsJ